MAEYVVPVYIKDPGTGVKVHIGMATEETTPGVRSIQFAEGWANRTVEGIFFGDTFPVPEEEAPVEVAPIPSDPIKRKRDNLGR